MEVYNLTHDEVIATRPDLVEREISLEEEAADIGIERVLKSIDRKGYATGSRSGSDMLRTSTVKTAIALREWIEGRDKVSRKPPVLGYVKALDAEQMAFIVSRILIDGAMKEKVSYNNACVQVGKRVQQVVEYGVFKEANAGLAVKIERQIEKSTSASHSRAVLSAAFRAADFEGMKWEDSTCVSVGHVLISAFIDASGLFERIVRVVRKRSLSYVQPTAAMHDLLASGELTDAITMPYHYPMVIPPRNWTSVYNGGYLDQHLHGLKLVKTGPKELNALDATDLRDVQDALNAVQSTPWAINNEVLSVMDFIHAVGGSKAGMTSSVIPDLPVKPWGELDSDAWEAFRVDPDNTDAIKEYKKTAALVYESRVQWTSKRLVQHQQLAVAERFKDEDAIYFPHELDFRGRIYPTAGLGSVNPQANDAGKGLLRFARGKALGASGAHWLAIHCANVYGKDKISMDDRVLWAHSNTAMMVECAADPLVRNEWMSADKPFQFLAACFEWAGYQLEGEAFVSRLPVALDGTCSGMQHFAAMARDEASAKSVNVMQVGDTPADLYTKVLDKVVESLPAGSEWASRISRKIVKQPCMTTPYSVTLAGMKDQIESATRKGIADGSIEPFSGNLQEACADVTPLVADAIRGTAGASVSVMDWLQEVAKVTGKAGHALSWSTPNGLRVKQEYTQKSTNTVKVTWNGKVTKMSLRSGTKELKVSKQVSSIAPNFVHSMDACHLQVTVANMESMGVHNFACIHDSFATHACDTQLLADVLRECFIAMYEGDTLGDLMLDLEEQLPADVFNLIPPPPTRGTLDLNCVRDSEYFFA